MSEVITQKIVEDEDDRSLAALLLIDLPVAYIKLLGIMIVYCIIVPPSMLNYKIFKLRGKYIKKRRQSLTKQ